MDELNLPVNIGKVLDIFNSYYGEDRVDLRLVDNSYNIIVWFPLVTVTNEYGESTTVQDIFVKTGLYDSGKLRRSPLMARSTFTYNQARSGYRHSHCSLGLPYSPDEYGTLCFGSGPINSTLSSLYSEFDEALWTLFCGELDLYVQTESVSGVPYIRLSSIGSSRQAIMRFNLEISHRMYFPPPKKLFLEYLLKNYEIPVAYKDGVYQIAMTFPEFVLFVSSAAKAYSTLSTANVDVFSFSQVILKNGKFFMVNGYSRLDTPEGVYVTFKNQRFPLVITHIEDEEDVTPIEIVDNSTLQIVYSFIYRLLNLVYGK